MSNTDSSSSARLRQIKAQTLANYHAQNPTRREGGGSRSIDASVVVARAPGVFPVVRQMDSKPAQITAACCGAPTPTCIQVVAPTDVTSAMTGGEDELYTWTPDPNATSYTFSSTIPDLVTFSNGTLSSVTLNYSYNYLDPGYTDPTFTITAHNSCSSASVLVTTFPCFLAGSLVTLADGTAIPIEDVRCGDQVLGAFGEINTVLALHRPLLGKAGMIRINDEHSSTAHHPHIGSNKEFYCANIAALETATYGCEHEVLNADGNKEMRMLHGLKAGRTQLYALGTYLKTVEGSRVLESLDHFTMPEDTQLYNLVISGSHTYHVDGYAVTGWPREDDFNYDVWEPIHT